MTSRRDLETAYNVIEKIRPLLVGKGAPVQGVILAELTAIWLKGHVVVGDKRETNKKRMELLKMHCYAVLALIEEKEERDAAATRH